MVFRRSKVLTGLVTFSMAAAVTGIPARAMGYPVWGTKPDTISPITGNVITPENAQAELVADVVLSIADPGNRVNDTDEIKAIADSASDQNSLHKDKPQLAVAAPNIYLNIHTDASLGSDVIGKLYSNDVAKILQDNGGDWVKIKSGKLVGYVLGEYLVRGEEAELLSELVKKNVATVDENNTEVEVRKYKSGRSVVTTVLPGEQIVVEENMEEETDGWIEVSTENGRGYVRSEEINISDSYPVAETVEEQQERLENSTVKDIFDNAQEKADKALEVAKAATAMAEEAVKRWCTELAADCLGLMFLKDMETVCELTPLVYVPACETTFWENSCASGTASVGMFLSDEKKSGISLDIREPGGCIRVISDRTESKTYLSEKVYFLGSYPE